MVKELEVEPCSFGNYVFFFFLFQSKAEIPIVQLLTEPNYGFCKTCKLICLGVSMRFTTSVESFMDDVHLKVSGNLLLEAFIEQSSPQILKIRSIPMTSVLFLQFILKQILQIFFISQCKIICEILPRISYFFFFTLMQLQL